MRRRSFICAGVGAMAAVATIAVRSGMRRHSGAALGFGTTISVTLMHDDARQAELAIEDALSAAQSVDRLMSIYNPASQVYQLNRDGVLARPHPHLLAVLAQARELSRLSDGAFDVTVQPLWQTFNAAAQQSALPSDQQRLSAQARVDWRRLEFDSRQARLRGAGMAITLNGLAQGYAADLALAALQARGVRHALIDAGEFVARGRRRGAEPWTLGVRDPREADALAATLYIDGCGVATSGDYEAAFTPDFAHHHIFDPALGDSPTELASVTVLAPNGMLADGLSTAFMVMGRDKARAMAAQLPGVDLMTIDKQGGVWRSATFPPTA
ncbi:MAG: FAD:protein FMN transferase [Pseudomonadota bacterium]